VTLILPNQVSDEADPRRTQKRVAVSFTGRQVYVDITGDDRLRLIKSLPGRWPEVMMARESGQTLEQIHRWAHVPLNHPSECYTMMTASLNRTGQTGQCDPPCLRCHMAAIYNWLETELSDLAQRRGKLMS
jgi:hypothetical protein